MGSHFGLPQLGVVAKSSKPKTGKRRLESYRKKKKVKTNSFF